MTRLRRMAVAMVATVALAFTGAAGVGLWQLWRHPLDLDLERTSEGYIWRGRLVTAELTLRDGAFEQLVVWRTHSPEELLLCLPGPTHE